MVRTLRKVQLMCVLGPLGGDRKGAVLIEACLLLPGILLVVMLVFFLQMHLVYFAVDATNLVAQARQESFNWIKADDGLYWDVDPQKWVKGEDRRDKTYLDPYQVPGIAFGYEGGVSRQLSYLTYNLVFSYKTRVAACMPTYSLRTGHLVDQELLPFLKKLLASDSDHLKNLTGNAYIVNDSIKSHDYLKVYHVSKDCQYARNKRCKVMPVGQAVDQGYRPCVVCLKKEIANMP